MEEKKNILILTPLRFYSPEDEALFFQWIDGMRFIKSYKGIGRELHLNVSNRSIDFNDYRSIHGLFKRYKLKNIDQLKKVFGTKENEDWFD